MQEKIWQQKTTYSAKDIKQINPIPDLVHHIKSLIPEISTIEITTILTELYNNSVDHGLLDLSSEIKTELGLEEYYHLRKSKLNDLEDGSVTLSMTYNSEEEVLIINIVDTGVGFDYKKYTTMPLMLHKVSGKGLYIINRLADKVEYSDHGRNITVTYKIRAAEKLQESEKITQDTTGKATNN